MFECLNFQKAHYFSHTAAENLIFILSINTAKHFSLMFQGNPVPGYKGSCSAFQFCPSVDIHGFVAKNSPLFQKGIIPHTAPL